MSLVSLPGELLLAIAGNLEQYRDFNALARTTRGMHSFLNLHLYQRSLRRDDSYAFRLGLLLFEPATVQYSLEAGADPNKVWHNPFPLSRWGPPLGVLIYQRHRIHEMPGPQWGVRQRGLKNGCTVMLPQRSRGVYDAAIQLLLEYGANPRGHLARAACHPQSDLLRVLLEGGAHRRLAGSEEGDALVNAVAYNFDAVQLMFDHGLDINAVDAMGRTAFRKAVLALDCEKARFLTERGADIHAGRSGPIVHMIFNTDGILWKWDCERKAMLEFLLGLGADINALFDDGNTVLYRCLLYPGSAQILEDLVSLGADANARTSDGHTLFHFAAQGITFDGFVPLIHSLGVDINARDEMGDTALHQCVILNSHDMVTELLELGADAHVEDKDGVSVLDMARKDRVHKWSLAGRRVLDHYYRRSPRLRKRKRGE